MVEPQTNFFIYAHPKKCRNCGSGKVIRHGQRRRICKDCGQTFSLEKNITKRLRSAAEQWILDRSTLRRIEERTDVNFTAKWRRAQVYAKHIPFPLMHYVKNRERASHVLLLDATFTRVKGEDRAIMIAYDTGIGVLDYWIDVTENATAYFLIFQHLDGVGYQPLCVVSDGHDSITTVLRDRNLPHQRCIFHLLKNLKYILMVQGEFREPKDLLLFARIRWIFLAPAIEDLPRRLELFRVFERAFSGRRKVFEWFWKVLPEAVLHLSYAKPIPRTTTLLENLNGQVKQRLKTMRGVKSEKSLRNLLKILFYFRKYK